jgi:hypothetical protein
MAEHFKFLETALINYNSVHKGFKIGLKERNAYYYYYYAVQSLLSFGLLAKNVKILENCNFVRFVRV